MKRTKSPKQPARGIRESHVVSLPGEHEGNGFTGWAMIGLSGFACLVYQILWMRQLGLLFGNTSQATA